MYKQKPVYDREGKFITGPYMSNIADERIKRIQPDRRWFGKPFARRNIYTDFLCGSRALCRRLSRLGASQILIDFFLVAWNQHSHPLLFSTTQNKPTIGNTRVVGQRELEKFREEMTTHVNDPYTVVMRSFVCLFVLII